MLKTVLPFVLIFTFFSTLHAQTTSELRKREIGLRLSSVNNFGVIYKYQIKDNKYRRFHLASGRIQVQNTDFTNFSTDFSAAFGSEKRVSISDKAQFLHGLEFSGGLSFATARNSNALNISPGVGYALGFLYQPNKNFNISLEGAVGLSASYQFVTGGDWIDNAALSLHFNSNNLRLNLVYCFESKRKSKK